MNAQFDTGIIFKPHSHISAFSNPLIPVITGEKQNLIQLYYWGLIPKWVKSSTKANELRRMTYNAKSETIKAKPSFKDAIKDQKCLVIADGFYEWETTSNGKVCHFIRPYERDIFVFAGIWSNWLDVNSGEIMYTVSIITQSANKIKEKIHNVKKRQPVILHKHNQSKWLTCGLEYKEIFNESFNISLKHKIVNSPLKNKNPPKIEFPYINE